MNDVQPEAVEGRLPFRHRWPIAAGVVTGLALRLLYFGAPGSRFAAMSASFIFLAPFLVGMVTVYVAERTRRRTWVYYISASSLATLLFVAGTLAIMLEGLICAVLIVPMFVIVGMLGGVLMGLVCRSTNWPRRTLYSFAALPLVLGALEPPGPLPQRLRTLERSVSVNAPAARVWQEIWNVHEIRPEELQHGWIYRIGVPLPIAAVTEQTSEGPVRRVQMGKHIHFDQVVVASQPERLVHWRYHFAEDSFPPAALDDHVRIGGHYFDLIDTSYALTPQGAGTELRIRMNYRLSTRFNWYAEPIANLLIGNFEETVLQFYRQRSERGVLPAALAGS